MSSWGFLVKRIIHTVITLIIVLVLLFIIFRMMPGDPSKFFIEPGMDPAAYHLRAVRYGFEKEEIAPGNLYEYQRVSTTIDGAYGLEINVTDDNNDYAIYYAVFNKGTDAKEKILKVDDNISYYGTSISPEEPALGTQVTMNLEFICEVTCESPYPVNITHDGVVLESISLTYIEKYTEEIRGVLKDIYRFEGMTQALSDPGNYYISFDVYDQSEALITNVYGFSINPDPSTLAPFSITNFNIVESLGEIRVSASITSTTNINKVSLVVTSPNNVQQPYTMLRAKIYVSVPVWEQFVIYMKNMLSFDFGNSFVSGRPVWDELAQKIPPTLLLFGSALILSAIIGILLGVVMAWRRGSKFEIAGIVGSLFFYSMPIFWFGLILLALFSFQLGWFPLRGMLTPGKDYQGLEYVADLLWHLTLPLITLTIAHLAGWLLLMRNSMLEVMTEDYITTAKAKGLTERKVMYRHASRNALLPIVTAIALSLGTVVSGGVLTETIFSWPGMGQYLVASTYSYDFPAVQGAFFLLAILTIFANLIADLMYAYLDPRVRLSR